jgi:hypothetical protein
MLFGFMADIKEYRFLRHLLERQEELKEELQYFGISQPADLAAPQIIRPAVRRGLIQMVGDIFELTKGLSNGINKKIGLNTNVIRQFRNTASHNYGDLTDATAFICIMHCVDETLVQNVKDEIERLNTELNSTGSSAISPSADQPVDTAATASNGDNGQTRR